MRNLPVNAIKVVVLASWVAVPIALVVVLVYLIF